MQQQKGSVTTSLLIFLVIIIILGAGLYFVMKMQGTPAMPAPTATSTAPVAGVTEYSDPQYGFTFWYPSALSITSSNTTDSNAFPGGTVVETLSVGSAGGTTVLVVDSPNSTITDEPANHASPISQTKYFYDLASSQWMVTFPQGNDSGASSATTTATISKSTIGNLPMLSSGLRFDTTIIPLSTTRFVVVTDGGGSSFTFQLAQTLALANGTIDQTALVSALQAEVGAYAQMQ